MKHRLSRPTPIRLHQNTESRLKTVAEKFGIKPAQLIRFAVDKQLDEFERDGRIIIESQPIGN